MPKGDDEFRFKASAYLQRLIGRELFRSDEMAIVELVKNAYDSGAKHVDITIQQPTIKQPGVISIQDDGSGMSIVQFRGQFMFAGFSSRPQEVAAAERIPTGEKGIGRFAADRLGVELEILTKIKEDDRTLCVAIDWSDFDNRAKEFGDVTVPFTYRRAVEFKKDEQGTLMRITRLRDAWERSKILALRAALSELFNPFEALSQFIVTLSVVGSPALSGAIQQSPLSGASIELHFLVEKDGKVRRKIKGSEHPTAKGGQWAAGAAVLSELKGVRGRLLYFLARPSKNETQGLEPGVRLFRDGFRIEPFGSNTADWLGVAEKRAKRAGHAHIVPSRLFGFVGISRTANPDLIDTTSREALIDTTAARALVKLLREQLEVLEEIIRAEIAEPRWEENQSRKVAELESARLQALNLMSYGLAHELRQPLHTVQLEVDNIKTRLVQLEIDDPDINEAHANVTTGIERIEKSIQTIASLAKGDLGVDSDVDLAKVVSEVCGNLEARCASEGITIQVKSSDKHDAYIDETLFRIVLLNLLRNSMDAHVNTDDGRNREIKVVLSKVNGKHQLIVTDNAYGIPEGIRAKIFKQFNTQKTGGWGVGLYFCHTMLRARGGEIAFTTKDGVGTTFTVLFLNGEVSDG
ncbi:MAG: sensor histidine kinase [Acidobacteria bacterium]|nr:sensor histidine kinase [Acidobacteriota bacterium]